MGGGRPNWYYDHPPACTCATCNEQRMARIKKDGLATRLKRAMWPFGKGRKKK